MWPVTGPITVVAFLPFARDFVIDGGNLGSCAVKQATLVIEHKICCKRYRADRTDYEMSCAEWVLAVESVIAKSTVAVSLTVVIRSQQV